MSQAEPTGKAEAIDRFIARRETRQEDWDVFSFQEKADPTYRRAQLRYVGGGGTEKHDDPNTIPAGHFTLSIMVLPPGHGGPMHYHETEEVFFVLEGQVEFSVHDVEDGNKKASRVLGYRDLIRVPAGVPRSLRTVSDDDALICVIIGAKKPEIPFYPPTSEMYGVTR